ncbi:hypothetical protein GE061_008030 [Apolygus lucorum]|uniref:Uncharacterized protein n=1 Tax=Apolygus lucorum TaxID=248454 RepID=A0A8S9WN94_APOLU|nr:hypothetical protein GE061_008030 [Apolygus lucorum]
MKVILLISVFVLILQGLVAEERRYNVIPNCDCTKGINKPEDCYVCREPANQKAYELISPGLTIKTQKVCHCEI